MSTCKALLSKITNKNAFYEQEDVTQNIFRSVWWESAFYSIRL